MSKNTEALLEQITFRMKSTAWIWTRDKIEVDVGEVREFKRGRKADTSPHVVLRARRPDGVEVSVQAMPASDRFARAVWWTIGARKHSDFASYGSYFDKTLHNQAPDLMSDPSFQGRGWLDLLAYDALRKLERLLSDSGDRVLASLARRESETGSALEEIRNAWAEIATRYGAVVTLDPDDGAVIIGKSSSYKAVARANSARGKLFINYALKSCGNVSPVRLRLIADLAEAAAPFEGDVRISP